VVVPVALLTAVAWTGVPPWEHPRDPDRDVLRSTPTYKVPLTELDEVRRALRIPHGDGPVLMPAVHMEVLAAYTTRDFAVVPRAFYTRSLDGYPGEREDRLALSKFASGVVELPSQRLRQLTQRLGVSMACLVRERPDDIVTMLMAGFRVAEDAGGLTCLVPQPGAATPAR
jgi:hypothetical protein